MGIKVCTKKASAFTGLAVSSLETARCRKTPGYPPFYKLGRRVVYDLDELADWLRCNRRCQ